MPRVGEKFTISDKNHENLLQHIRERLWWAQQIRGPFTDRITLVDKEIHGHLVLDSADKQRDQENKRGLGIKPVDSKLPMALVQIDEAVTICANMLSPDEGMYQAIAPRDSQEVARGFTSMMNKHSQQFNHYGNLVRGIGSIFKYNLGGWSVEWDQFSSQELVNKGASQTEFDVVSTFVNSGNRFSALDMYNTIWDPSVHIAEIGAQGEFFAEISRVTAFTFDMQIQQGNVFNVESSDEVKLNTAPAGAEGRNAHTVNTYYVTPPTIRSSGSLTVPSWTEILGGTEVAVPNSQVEIIKLHIWLRDSDFGLGKEKKFRLYRVKTANLRKIVDVQEVVNAHDMLPLGMAAIIDDELGMNAKSYAELLEPFNQFSSFQLNSYKKSVRRSLYGLTFYLKGLVPDLANSDTDMLCGNIPVDDSRGVDDIRKAILQINDSPQMQQVLQDLSRMDEIMQKVLPTDLLKQVTDLERATQYQAAATVQGTNRRSLKIAKMIDAQALFPTRQMQMLNIFQFAKEVTILQEDGTTIEVKPSELRDTQLEFVVSEGLKALDKLSAINNIKEILTRIIQNRQAIQEIDVVALLNYLTSLMGDKTDLAQFKFKNQFDALEPQQKQIAFQLFEQYIQQQQQEQGGANTGSSQSPNAVSSGLQALQQGISGQNSQ